MISGVVTDDRQAVIHLTVRESVEVLAIVPKSEAAIWLEQFGKPE